MAARKQKKDWKLCEKQKEKECHDDDDDSGSTCVSSPPTAKEVPGHITNHFLGADTMQKETITLKRTELPNSNKFSNNDFKVGQKRPFTESVESVKKKAQSIDWCIENYPQNFMNQNVRADVCYAKRKMLINEDEFIGRQGNNCEVSEASIDGSLDVNFSSSAKLRTDLPDSAGWKWIDDHPDVDMASPSTELEDALPPCEFVDVDTLSVSEASIDGSLDANFSSSAKLRSDLPDSEVDTDDSEADSTDPDGTSPPAIMSLMSFSALSGLSSRQLRNATQMCSRVLRKLKMEQQARQQTKHVKESNCFEGFSFEASNDSFRGTGEVKRDLVFDDAIVADLTESSDVSMN